MPPADAKPKPDGKPGAKPKGKGKGIGRKVGPLPLWAWLGLGAVGAVILWQWSRGRGGEGGGSPVELVSGGSSGGGYSPAEAAYGGGMGTATAPAAGLSPDVLDQVFASAREGASQYDIQDELLDRFAQVEAGGYGAGDLSGVYAYLDELLGSYGGVQAPSPSAGAPTPANTRGVAWGGQTFTTRQALASWLGARGASYSAWAARHPQAATRLTGPAPKPKAAAKPKAPTRTAAPPKRAPKPKAAGKPASKPAPKRVYKTYKTQVKLKPGQRLKYTKGKGYYAG